MAPTLSFAAFSGNSGDGAEDGTANGHSGDGRPPRLPPGPPRAAVARERARRRRNSPSTTGVPTGVFGCGRGSFDVRFQGFGTLGSTRSLEGRKHPRHSFTQNTLRD